MAVHMGNVDQAISTAKKVQEYISVGFDTCIDVATDLAEHEREHGSSGTDSLSELQKVMLEYVEMERQMNDAVAAAEAVKTAARQGQLGDKSMTEFFNDKLAESTSEGNPEDHPRVKELEQRLQEAMNADDAATPGTLVTEEPDDEEIEWVIGEVNTKCPYTGKEMVRPVQNKHCKHNYDKEGILELIKMRGNRAKCPVAGCGNKKPVEKDDLEDNVELKKIIAKKNRQAAKKRR